VIFLLLRFLLTENSMVAALLSAVLMLFSRNNIIASAHITPHGLYVLLVVVTLVFMAKYLATGETRYWYVTVVAAALSFMTIEFALLLVASLLLCLFAARKELFPGWTRRQYVRFILRSTLLFVATVIVFWPGSILKFTVFKNLLLFTYYVLVRGSEYGDQTFFDAWVDRIATAPVEFTVVIIALFLAVKLVSKDRKLLPFLVYSGFLFLTTIRNTSQSPMYISSFLPPLFILSGIVFAAHTRHLKPALRVVPVLLVAGALAAFTFLKTIPGYREIAGSHALRDVVTFVRGFPGEKESLLVDRDLLPTLHYYFPGEKFKSFSEESGDNKRVDELLSRFHMKGILIATKARGVRELEQRLDKKYFFAGHFITYMEEGEKTVFYYKIKAKP